MAFIIKNQCATCRGEFQNSQAHYQQNGNYCPSCSNKCSLLAELRGMVRNGSVNSRRGRRLAKILQNRYKITVEDIIASQRWIDLIKGVK